MSGKYDLNYTDSKTMLFRKSGPQGSAALPDLFLNKVDLSKLIYQNLISQKYPGYFFVRFITESLYVGYNTPKKYPEKIPKKGIIPWVLYLIPWAKSVFFQH